jgi:hypothetical protein
MTAGRQTLPVGFGRKVGPMGSSRYLSGHISEWWSWGELNPLPGSLKPQGTLTSPTSLKASDFTLARSVAGLLIPTVSHQYNTRVMLLSREKHNVCVIVYVVLYYVVVYTLGFSLASASQRKSEPPLGKR